MRNIPYREAVGSLMYASLGTRPISLLLLLGSPNSLKILVSLTGKPARNVLRYLNGTRSHWPCFRRK